RGHAEAIKAAARRPIRQAGFLRSRILLVPARAFLGRPSALAHPTLPSRFVCTRERPTPPALARNAHAKACESGPCRWRFPAQTAERQFRSADEPVAQGGRAWMVS